MNARRLIPPLSFCLVVVGAISAGLGQRDWAPQFPEFDRYERRPQRERADGHPAPTAPDDRRSELKKGTEEGMPQTAAERNFGRFYLRPQWCLGVFAYNTSRGVVITYVMPRSPASRAGFEAGDRIVTVDGFQVGFVNHNLYPLGEELQFRAEPHGRVCLLAQNLRNDKLIHVDVRLERRRYGQTPEHRQRDVPGRRGLDDGFEDEERPWSSPGSEPTVNGV